MERLFDRAGKLGLAMIGTGIFANNFVFVVDGGERALKMSALKGLQSRVYGEGMHFRIPMIDSIVRFEIRTQPTMIHSTTGTNDMQTVNVSMRLLYRPIPENLPVILSNIGQNYDERVIPSIGNEVLKSTVAQYNAEQLISMRERVSKEIKDSLQKRALEYSIILDDVSITDLQFSPEFTAAIESKQVAQQMAERAKFIVFKREEETKAAVLRAEGEAEAAKLVADAISEYGPGLIAMRKIEAAAHIAESLKNSPNVTFLSGNTMNMVNLSGSGI